MGKRKLYILLAILTIIFLLSISAICNQCEAAAINEEKIGIKEDEEIADEEEAPVEEETAAGKENGEETEEEKTGEEEAETEEEDEEETGEEAPTIILKIYEGPVYSPADSICYYRIKATVTGNPSPTVEWSKDDSSGAWGTKKAQVNLNNPSETYTLIATATNSEGSDTDSLELSWGCENINPEITGISFSNDKFYKNEQYDITAIASDPDGDDLYFEWSASRGSFENNNINPVKWTAPGTSTGGSINITVSVSDGKGGTSTKTESIVLEPTLIFIEPFDIGYVVNAGGVNHDSLIIGDSISNEDVRGFCTFDLSSLSGKEIFLASFQTYPKNWGDPSFKGSIKLYYTDYYPLDSNDYYISSSYAGPFTIEDSYLIKYKDSFLTSTVQDRSAPTGSLGFSFKYENNSTDGDYSIDGREFFKTGTHLVVAYYD